jgi:hypothetical protein
LPDLKFPHSIFITCSITEDTIIIYQTMHKHNSFFSKSGALSFIKVEVKINNSFFKVSQEHCHSLR